MKPSTEQDYHQRIVRTLVYIQEHLDDTLQPFPVFIFTGSSGVWPARR
jgi:hypothetical protein